MEKYLSILAHCPLFARIPPEHIAETAGYLQPEIKHLLLILTSDHVITPTEAFIHDCAAACEYAQKNFFVGLYKAAPLRQ